MNFFRAKSTPPFFSNAVKKLVYIYLAENLYFN